MSTETLAERLVKKIIEEALRTGGAKPPPPEPEPEKQQ